MSNISCETEEDKEITAIRKEIHLADIRRQRRAERNSRLRKRRFVVAAVLCLIVIVGACMFIVNSFHETDDKIFSSGYAGGVNQYSEIYYYEADKANRYEEYGRQNPGMSYEEIVWRVNANLDMPWYEYDIPASDYDDPYIIVNKYYKVPEDYCPPDLVEVDGCKMRRETGEAYLEMKKAAAGEGLKLRVVSAYRTVEYQKNLYEEYLSTDSKENVDRYSARPGYSEHHTGMAIDLFGSVDGLRNFKDTPEYTWVVENCYRYGFIIRYTSDIENVTGYESEPWHIRYVGRDVSADMKEKGIASFEEYHVKYIEHSPYANAD